MYHSDEKNDTQKIEKQSQKQERQYSGPGVQEAISRGAETGKTSAAPQQKTFREKLFDRDIIGKLAQGKKEDKKTDNRITLNTKGYKYYGYEQMAANKMLDKWELPLDYKYKGIAGEVEIGYTIRKNGMLSNVEIIRTSGHVSLDSAAIKAIKDAEPYWPLPDEWGEDSYTSSMHFTYEPFAIFWRRPGHRDCRRYNYPAATPGWCPGH